jgi:MFS transporter, PAT family, beta-lactamase induction signal transducer AmpG
VTARSKYNIFHKQFSYETLKLLLIFTFGVVNGLLLQITWVTVNFWLSVNGVDLKTISIFSLASLPYSLKYILGPLIDYLSSSSTGKYKTYKFILYLSFSVISALVYYLSFLSVKYDLLKIGLICSAIALFSAIIDIILNILRIELTDKSEHGKNSSAYIIGYRIGMLVTGAGTIFISNYISWHMIFIYLSLIILAANIFIYLSPLVDQKFFFEENNNKKLITKNLQYNNFFSRIFIKPFEHIHKLSNFLYIIVFLVLYKTSDHMLVIMLQPMLIKLQYTAIEIATAGKSFGVICAIIGGFIAGKLMKDLSINNSLFIFGILHITSYFFLFPLYNYGHNIVIFYIFTAMQATTSGMTMVAYISYISSLCTGDHKGTQYAIFYSLMGVSRAIFPTSSGYIVSKFNWNIFFLILITISVISIMLIKKIKHIK